MKKLISTIIAMVITTSFLSANVFAENTIEKTQLSNLQYTDKLIEDDAFLVTYSAVDAYEPNDFDNPYHLNSIINSTSKPIQTLNANLNLDDTMDAYEVDTMGTENYSDVSEVVVLISGLNAGDEINILVNNSDYYSSGTLNGSYGSVGYLSLPSLRPTSDRYTIYISASNFANQEINYSLQIASRYIRAEAEFNTSPSSIYNSNNTSYSSPANVRISSTSGIPRSAVVDKILTKGNVTSNETGRGTTAYIKVTCGSTTLYVYSGPVGYIENLTSQNISMYGTWNVSFLQHISGPCTFSNISLTFYYTYDVLNV